MRRQPRGNVQALGPTVAQDFSTADLAGNAYPKSAGVYTPRDIEYLARYGWSLDSDGIPEFGADLTTFGPRGGRICLRPDSGTARKLAQWGDGGVPCMVTNASPLKVRPIYKVSGGSPYVTDPSLGDITVVAPTSYTPTVGDPGTLMQGSDLQSEQFVFLPYTTAGGGGGGGGGGGYFGDGSDGAITPAPDVFGNAGPIDPYYGGAVSPFSLTSVVFGQNDDTGVEWWVWILLRDLYCTTFTLPATLTTFGRTKPFMIFSGGYKIFATVSATINGVLAGDGWVFSGGATGGGGYTTSAWPFAAASFPGGRPTNTPPGIWKPYPQVASNGTGAGAPGSAGVAAGHGQGDPAGGSGPCRNAASWVVKPLTDFEGGWGGYPPGPTDAPSGAGGAPVFLASPTISGAGKVQSNGAKGFNASAATNGGAAAGGGAGANPGPIYMIGETITVATSSVPGAGGTGFGGGPAGSAGGGAGLVRKYKPSTDTYS